jgi:hypothetical protein
VSRDEERLGGESPQDQLGVNSNLEQGKQNANRMRGLRRAVADLFEPSRERAVIMTDRGQRIPGASSGRACKTCNGPGSAGLP